MCWRCRGGSSLCSSATSLLWGRALPAKAYEWAMHVSDQVVNVRTYSRAEPAPTGGWRASAVASHLQDVIGAAAGFLDDDVDEVQLGDHGRWQHEGVEVGLTHGA